MENSKVTLYIDGKDQHLEEDNALVIHPKKLGLANCFEKSSFDKVIIKNSPTEFLKSLGFFNIARALKEGGICEIYVDQPIVVMQSLEKDEIEANAKLGGFSNIVSQPYEEWISKNGQDVKIETIKMTMAKA